MLLYVLLALQMEDLQNLIPKEQEAEIKLTADFVTVHRVNAGFTTLIIWV